SGKMTVDSSNKLWIFTKTNINYFTVGKLSTKPKLNTIPIPSSLTNSMLGYENISHLSENRYLVGTTDGYYLLNINDFRFNTYKINITAVEMSRHNEPPINIAINTENEIPYTNNNVYISYAVP